MPYQKTFHQKKRFPRSKRKSTLALKAYRLAKKATNTMELHKHTLLGNSVRAGNDVGAVLVNNIAEGDLSSSRTGLRIWARSLRLHYECMWSASANPTDEAVRVIVVRDKMCNGTAPLVSDILQEANTYASISQRHNETEGKRFVFLYDKVHRNPNQVATDTYTTGRKLIIPLRFPVHYTGSTAGIGDMGKNSIFIYFVGDQTIASTLSPNVRNTYRFFFDP